MIIATHGYENKHRETAGKQSVRDRKSECSPLKDALEVELVPAAGHLHSADKKRMRIKTDAQAR